MLGLLLTLGLSMEVLTVDSRSYSSILKRRIALLQDGRVGVESNVMISVRDFDACTVLLIRHALVLCTGRRVGNMHMRDWF